MDDTSQSSDFQLDLSSFELPEFGGAEMNDIFAAQTGLPQSQPPQHFTTHVDHHVASGRMGSASNELGQGSSNTHPHPPAIPPQINPQGIVTAAMLKEQLEHQMRLQHLQQLQNQILRQQIELISGQVVQDPTTQLLTPASSSEIRATVHRDHVPPMVLQSNLYRDTPPSGAMSSLVSPILTPAGNPYQNPTMSAPAALAFPNIPAAGSPGTFFTPLTSPVIPPVNGGYASEASQPQRNKRPASITPVEEKARKRQTQAAAASSVSAPKRGNRTPASMTPNLKATRSRRSGSVPELQPQSTPSPVDLSMPPPAPPAPPPPSSSNASESHSTSSLSPSSASVSPNIAPVTPGSIMNLGPLALPAGLVPPADGEPKKEKGKSKTSAPTRTVKKSPAIRPMVSPGLKPILPGGISASSAAHLAAHPNYKHHMSGTSSSLNITPSTPLPPPPLQVRKTSHKAAEQKRRDSLKSSFDDLRLLLPPIPVSADMDPDDPPLPGAMPPRGPPRGDGDGPNRGVSKLALLRCGNDFIRQLKGQIARRDDEIEKLRAEVARLRLLVDPEAAGDLDLEKDLDAGEEAVGRSRGASREVEVLDEVEEEGGE